MRRQNKRLALALGLVAMLTGGGDGDILGLSWVGAPYSVGIARDLPYGGLAALAEAAPSATPGRVPVPHVHTREGQSGGSVLIAALISAYPWPQDEAWAVLMCESEGDPNAWNPSGARGLYQILPKYHAWRVGGDLDSLYDPAVNVRVAFDIFVDNGGFAGPWAACS